MTLPEQVTFEAAFRAHAPCVWRLLRRQGLREAEAEDACQEVFLVVHKKLADFRGGTSLRSWIYSIAARVASEQRRRPYRRREELAGDDLPDWSAPATQEEDVSRLRARLPSLPRPYVSRRHTSGFFLSHVSWPTSVRSSPCR